MKIVVIVLVAYFFQVFVSITHSINYKKTMKDVITNNVGYLAVGVTQNKMFNRTVTILVVNKEGTISDCRVLKGVALTSRFKEYNEIINEELKVIEKKINSYDIKESLKQAIDEIYEQMNRDNSNNKEI